MSNHSDPSPGHPNPAHHPASRVRSPLRWYGSKAILVPRILPHLPPHRFYVEVFGGGASILLSKPLAPDGEVYNDINPELPAFFRILADPALFERFYRLALLTPYSKEEYDEYKASWRECQDPVERAYRWYVVNRMSFSGHHGEGWAHSIKTSTGGMADSANSWRAALRALPAFSERMRSVTIECLDWRDLLDHYDRGPDTLFYLDPPYVLGTRRGGARYGSAELSDYDHMQLVERLLRLRSQAVLSGYAHPLYEPLEDAGWERVDIPWSDNASLKQGRGADERVETLWIRRLS